LIAACLRIRGVYGTRDFYCWELAFLVVAVFAVFKFLFFFYSGGAFFIRSKIVLESNLIPRSKTMSAVAAATPDVTATDDDFTLFAKAVDGKARAVDISWLSRKLGKEVASAT